MPQLLGKSAKDRRYLVTQGGALSIISNGWKYITPGKGAKVARLVNIELGNDEAAQLYNVNTDTGERKNEAVKHPDKVQALAALLNEVKAAEKSR